MVAHTARFAISLVFITKDKLRFDVCPSLIHNFISTSNIYIYLKKIVCINLIIQSGLIID